MLSLTREYENIPHILFTLVNEDKHHVNLRLTYPFKIGTYAQHYEKDTEVLGTDQFHNRVN